MTRTLIFAALALIVWSASANARVRHIDAPVMNCAYDNNGRVTCGAVVVAQVEAARWSSDERVVAHPSGCPRTAFCGCGASVEVFGHPIRELFLARAWLKFPRTAPAPGMAAVRTHHVFVIRTVNADGTVVAYDANSGRHQTRVHTVSLRGYTVVDPHSRTYASLNR